MIDKKIQVEFDNADEHYKLLGIDALKAVERLGQIKISLHCWQGDDVCGFEKSGEDLSGGISATGNYLGKARNGEELRNDLDLALSLIAGKHKINLHAIYAETEGVKVGRDNLETKHFRKWLDWAKKQSLGLDFNPTLFSHPLASDGLTLSHPDVKVRDFWIKHCQATRAIANDFAKELGQPCLHNIWIPDGFKDIPSDRLSPRERLKNSLDKIFSQSVDSKLVLDAVESKVFGIGVESYTVGSHEFYLNYANRNNISCLLDNGHFHPTESVADKLSSMYLFFEKVALHVTRPVRWDSDHVVILDEELKDIAQEIVRNNAIDRTCIGLDYFDASINRIAAWVLGTRNMQKALLIALLTPHKLLKEVQDSQNYTKRLVLMEELKSYPWSSVWNYFCQLNNVPIKEEWLSSVLDYETKVLAKR